ncbi:MAG: hypothetical protein HQL63_06225 [Magnetococcales bacterium]|nr:hypothetical protein [Magnetococcales bacterium]MBF0321628.1 hypothetical protein [Magnetococcales bacterium]
MSTQTVDLDKLAKVLNLTFADREGEVLNATRMAIRMLKNARMDFNDIFRLSQGSPRVEQEQALTVQGVRKEYDALIESLHRDYAMRIASLNRRIAQMNQQPSSQQAAPADVKSKEYQEEINALRRQVEWWKARNNQQLEKAQEKHRREIDHLNRRLDFWRNFATAQRA